MTLLDAITPGEIGSGSDCCEGVLRFPQSSSITGASLSDCFMLYPGHSLEQSYPSAKIQSVYSIAPVDGSKM